jgi:hypothetical protein
VQSHVFKKNNIHSDLICLCTDFANGLAVFQIIDWHPSELHDDVQYGTVASRVGTAWKRRVSLSQNRFARRVRDLWTQIWRDAHLKCFLILTRIASGYGVLERSCHSLCRHVTSWLSHRVRTPMSSRLLGKNTTPPSALYHGIDLIR